MQRLAAAISLIAGTIVAGALTGAAFGQAPKVSSISPLGLAPGESANLIFSGEALGAARGVWSNLSGLDATPVTAESAASSASFCITVPKDAPLGVYGVRLLTVGGASNLRLMMVDDLPTVRESGSHATLASAEEIRLPVAIEGTTEPEAYDFFRFHAAADTRLSVEVMARRLGSPLDPVIRLLDKNGNELCVSDDDEATGADSRFVHRFTQEGDYALELRDVRYQGGAAYRYRLRLGNFPLATATFPLAAREGTIARLGVVGVQSNVGLQTNLGVQNANGKPGPVGEPADAFEPIDYAVPLHPPGRRAYVPLRYPLGSGSSVVPVLTSDCLEQVEFEPNDDLEKANAITIPGAVNGRFELPHDKDFFRFAGKKGQQLSFLGWTRSLGVATVLHLRLFDSAGKPLAEVDHAGNEEVRLDVTLPDDGAYMLSAENLFNRAGPDRAYRIEICGKRPPFTLAADFDKCDAPRGGVMALRVVATRIGFTDAITLSLPTEGWKLENGTIAKGQIGTTLLITVPANYEPGQLHPFKLVGTATTDRGEEHVEVSPLTALRTSLAGLAYPPAALTEGLWVGIGPEMPPFFELVADAKSTSYPQQSGRARLAVKVKKLNKFDDKVSLSVDGLPPEFKAAGVVIEKGKSEATIEITGPPNVALGQYPLRVMGSASFQNQPKTVTLDLALQVTPPTAPAVKESGTSSDAPVKP